MKRIPLATYKARWRDGVMSDQSLRYSTRVLAYHLADYCTMRDSADKYRRQGKVFVWPSMEELVSRTNINIGTVSIGMCELRRRGHLKLVRRGNQFKGSNKYLLRLRKAGAST